MNDLQQNIDEFGLICFKGDEFDGGDTCSNEYTLQYILHVTHAVDFNRLRHVNSQLIVNGIPIRHPDPLKWYSSINRTSRDQYTPYLCWLIASKSSISSKTLLKRLKHCFLFAWNTRKNFQYPTLAEHLQRSTPDVKWDYRWKLPDFTGPDIWALELRLLSRLYSPIIILAYILLNLLDLYQLFNVLYSIYRHKKAPNYDRRNLTLKTHASRFFMPTIFSFLAWNLYKKAQIGQESAEKWWTKPGEPPLHNYVLRLFD